MQNRVRHELEQLDPLADECFFFCGSLVESGMAQTRTPVLLESWISATSLTIGPAVDADANRSQARARARSGLVLVVSD